MQKIMLKRRNECTLLLTDRSASVLGREGVARGARRTTKSIDIVTAGYPRRALSINASLSTW